VLHFGRDIVKQNNFAADTIAILYMKEHNMINSVNPAYSTYTSYEKKRTQAVAERLTNGVATISCDSKRAMATEMKNRILFGDECREKMTELTLELRKMIVEHGFVEGTLMHGSLRMHVNLGTEDEPVWAAIRGGQVFIKFGGDDSINEDTRVGDWIAPWIRLEDLGTQEDMPILDESLLLCLQQYKQLLNAVNSDETDSYYLFDNLHDAAEYFLDAYTNVSEDNFRSFVHWLFEMRIFSTRENSMARELADAFLDAFFQHRDAGADSPFAAAWTGILPPQAGRFSELG
jgi:hypothetical protein